MVSVTQQVNAYEFCCRGAEASLKARRANVFEIFTIEDTSFVSGREQKGTAAGLTRGY